MRKGYFMNNKKRKVWSLILAIALFCSMTTITALAAGTEDSNITVHDMSANDSGNQARIIRHLTATQWNSDHTVEVGVHYSLQDYPKQVVGIQSAYIASYNPNFITSAKVVGYEIQSPSQIRIKVEYYDTGNNFHYQEFYINV